MKLKNGMEIVSLDRRLGRVRMLSPFGAGDIAASDVLAVKLADPKVASQWAIQMPAASKNDNFNFQNIGDVRPRNEDYISVNFRALSKTTVPGHWIDWSKDDVLKNSLGKLMGATVYPNHDFTDINNWLGSVAQVAWDEEGTQTDGVAGINAQYKIDALMNPRIARGLLMTPPAIHSTSMTVLFQYEYSHPEIAAESCYRFYDLLGEEVEGHIVRFIVTEILEYWEASLVFQGADRLAKQRVEEESPESLESFESQESPEETPANSNEEKKTVRLSKEQKTSLGIEFDGDEVPDDQVFQAIDTLSEKVKAMPDDLAELQAKAKAGEAFIEQQRTEVTRLAKLAELGAEEGDLEPVIVKQLEAADFETLTELKGYYEKKVGDKFPQGGRSSTEDPAAVEGAGGVSALAAAAPEDGGLFS